MKFKKNQFIGIRTLLLSLVISITNASMAQSEGPDVIELKNGESKRGTVIEQKPGEYIKLLQTPSNDTLQIALLDIERMIKIVEEKIEDPALVAELDNQELNEDLDAKHFHQRGYNAHIYAALGGGTFTTAGAGIALYKTVLPQLQIGARIQFYGGESKQAMSNVVPLTLDIRYSFQNDPTKRTSGIFNLSTGYNILTDRNYFYNTQAIDAYQTNGLYIHPSLGIAVNLGKELGLQFDLGLQYMKSKGYSQSSDTFLQDYHYYNAVGRVSLFF